MNGVELCYVYPITSFKIIFDYLLSYASHLHMDALHSMVPVGYVLMSFFVQAWVKPFRLSYSSDGSDSNRGLRVVAAIVVEV